MKKRIFINTIFFFALFIAFSFNVKALTKAPIDITKMDISSISEALNNDIITSEQLINLYLDRINVYNNDYDAIITINDKALEEAKNLDKERSNGKVRSILHGIPIIVKDNIDVLGMPTTAGAKSLSDNYPKEDAFAIKKLKDAGAIILAKANMSEFAFMASSSRSSYGTVKNAYNLSYNSYGSSGGAAVSVAASFAVAALGTDTNSSVRIPAAANNIVGYRPTFGTVSHFGVLPYDPERDTIGTLTKNVNDSIVLTNAINGYDEKDSKSINTTYEYKVTSDSLDGYRFGISNDFLNGSDENSLIENKAGYEEITSLMNKAIKLMKANGAKIIYLDDYYTYKEDGEVQSAYSGYLFCDSFNTYINGTTGSIRSFEELASSNGKITDLSGYTDSCNTTKTLDAKNKLKSNYRDHLNEIFDSNKLDAVIYPTTKNKLLELGTSGLINLSAHAAPTVGFAAINVPLGFDKDNLPYGMEFMTKSGNDELLFNIAYNYEKINANDITPSIAPSLYKVSTQVSDLVNKYNNNLEDKPNFIINKWIKKTSTYFKNYNDNDYNDNNDKAKSLNRFYYLYKALSYLWIFILFIIKIIIILIVMLILYAYLRKKYKRKHRKHKKHKKNV